MTQKISFFLLFRKSFGDIVSAIDLGYDKNSTKIVHSIWIAEKFKEIFFSNCAGIFEHAKSRQSGVIGTGIKTYRMVYSTVSKVRKIGPTHLRKLENSKIEKFGWHKSSTNREQIPAWITYSKFKRLIHGVIEVPALL